MISKEEKTLFNVFWNKVNQVMKKTKTTYHISDNQCFFHPGIDSEEKRFPFPFFINFKTLKLRDKVDSFSFSLNGEDIFQLLRLKIKENLTTFSYDETKITIGYDDKTLEFPLYKEEYSAHKKAYNKILKDSKFLGSAPLEISDIKNYSPFFMSFRINKNQTISYDIRESLLECKFRNYICLDKKFFMTLDDKKTNWRIHVYKQAPQVYIIKFTCESSLLYYEQFIQTLKL